MKLFDLTIVVFFLIFLGCKDSNKTISTEINTLNPSMQLDVDNSSDLHTVIVNEAVPSSNYVYLNVTEGDRKFWIATKTLDINIGDTYYYLGGSLKTDFESKELNRVFDEVYLIGNLVSSNHGNTAQINGDTANPNSNKNISQKQEEADESEEIEQHKGSIKIAELVKNQKQYEGKEVQIDGKCTKINVGIMGKNWIHLKDGSKDDFDLIVTSDLLIPVGAVVTIQGKVTLNKDFGAGYNYDLILEEGVLVKKDKR
tara:strand:+ start:2456 stop:3223 length:768 start_codon:yes stop_codon:yes gene_type:complete